MGDENENKVPSIYPTAPLETSPHHLLSLQNTNYSLKINLNQNRVNQFLLNKKVLEDLLIHYKKLKRKWTRIDSGLKISLITIGTTLSASTVAITSLSTMGGSLVLYAGIGVGALTLLTNSIGESLSIGISSKKKKVFREICECIEHGIDKLYLFNIKALKDNVITDEELVEAQKIVEDCKKNIINCKSNKNNELKNTYSGTINDLRSCDKVTNVLKNSYSETINDLSCDKVTKEPKKSHSEKSKIKKLKSSYSGTINELIAEYKNLAFVLNSQLENDVKLKKNKLYEL